MQLGSRGTGQLNISEIDYGLEPDNEYLDSTESLNRDFGYLLSKNTDITPDSGISGWSPHDNFVWDNPKAYADEMYSIPWEQFGSPDPSAPPIRSADSRQQNGQGGKKAAADPRQKPTCRPCHTEQLKCDGGPRCSRCQADGFAWCYIKSLSGGSRSKRERATDDIEERESTEQRSYSKVKSWVNAFKITPPPRNSPSCVSALVENELNTTPKVPITNSIDRTPSNGCTSPVMSECSLEWLLNSRDSIPSGDTAELLTEPTNVSDGYMTTKVTDFPSGEFYEDDVEVDDGPDDVATYRTAFVYFGLYNYSVHSPSSEVQDSPGDSSGASSSSCNLSASTYTAFSDSLGSISSSATKISSKPGSNNLSSNASTLATARPPRADPDCKPLDLLCWHAAMGIKCKGRTGRSHEVRRLYMYIYHTIQSVLICANFESDHSVSRKTSNNHKLSPPCGRCELLFPDSVTASEHAAILQSDNPCSRLEKEDLTRRNAIVERCGISPTKEAAIKQALRNFRGGNSKAAQIPVLPEGCTSEHFSTWVTRNIPLYIGESSTQEETAMKELSHWYIYFHVMFPGETIPPNPCKCLQLPTKAIMGSQIKVAESIEFRHRRLLDLLSVGLADAAACGTMPQLTSEQQATFSAIFNTAIVTLDAEVLKEKSRAGGSTKAWSRKRCRLDGRSTELSTVSSPTPPTLLDTARPEPCEPHSTAEEVASGSASTMCPDSASSTLPPLPESTFSYSLDSLSQPFLTGFEQFTGAEPSYGDFVPMDCSDLWGFDNSNNCGFFEDTRGSAIYAEEK